MQSIKVEKQAEAAAAEAKKLALQALSEACRIKLPNQLLTLML